MFTVPNQRVITTHKEKCGKDKENFYTIINLFALESAASNLSGSAFKLWIYLAKNQDRYKIALSRVDTMRFCGFSKNTYTAAFGELVDKGYLIQRDNNTYYDFYEKPQEETIIVKIHKE